MRRRPASVRALLEGPYAQRFDPSVVSLFLRALEAEDLPEETAFALDLSDAQREAYLRMIIYAIDFRSPHTVTHTITTTRISVEIARYLGCGRMAAPHLVRRAAARPGQCRAFRWRSSSSPESSARRR